MTREARTLFLSILTLTVYAVFIFIDQGSFVFPFPLNEFILLAISAQFFWWNRTGNRWVGILTVVAGVCAVLSNQFFWMFFYDHESMTIFMEGVTTDYFQLAFYSLILIGGVVTMIRQKKGTALLFSALFVLSFIYGAFLNSPMLLFLAFGCMVASTQLSKVFVPYHLLWILLFFLEFTKVLMILSE